MLRDMLFLGSADLADAIMYLNQQIPGHRMIVTELRGFEELKKEYGQRFLNNYERLKNAGALVYFGINALRLANLPVESSAMEIDHSIVSDNNASLTRELSQSDLKQIKYVKVYSPYFGKENEPNFPSFIQQIFANFEATMDVANLVVLIALDCLSGDALYNLNTRFGIFNVINWIPAFMVNMLGHYQFAASDSHGKNESGRVGLPLLQSYVVQGIIFKYSLGANVIKPKSGPWEYCTYSYMRRHIPPMPDDDACNCKEAPVYKALRKVKPNKPKPAQQPIILDYSNRLMLAYNLAKNAVQVGFHSVWGLLSKITTVTKNPKPKKIPVTAGRPYQTLYKLSVQPFKSFCRDILSIPSHDLSFEELFLVQAKLAKGPLLHKLEAYLKSPTENSLSMQDFSSLEKLLYPRVSFAEAFANERNPQGKRMAIPAMGCIEWNASSTIIHPTAVRPSNLVRRMLPRFFESPDRVYGERRLSTFNGLKHTPKLNRKRDNSQLSAGNVDYNELARPPRRARRVIIN